MSEFVVFLSWDIFSKCHPNDMDRHSPQWAMHVAVGSE